MYVVTTPLWRSYLEACRVGESRKPGPGRKGRPPKPRPPRWGIDPDRPAITPEEQKLRDMCTEKFLEWLWAEAEVELDDIAFSAELVGKLLRVWGKRNFAGGKSVVLLREATLGARDRYRHLRWQLGDAWELVQRWELEEPGGTRNILPRTLMRAHIAAALYYEWFRFVALLLMGFGGPLSSWGVIASPEGSHHPPFGQSRGGGGGVPVESLRGNPS